MGVVGKGGNAPPPPEETGGTAKMKPLDKEFTEFMTYAVYPRPNLHPLVKMSEINRPVPPRPNICHRQLLTVSVDASPAVAVEWGLVAIDWYQKLPRNQMERSLISVPQLRPLRLQTLGKLELHSKKRSRLVDALILTARTRKNQTRR